MCPAYAMAGFKFHNNFLSRLAVEKVVAEIEHLHVAELSPRRCNCT